MFVRFSGLVGLLLVAGACQVSLDAPPGVTISCAAGGTCPGELVCVQGVNACVEPGTSCVDQRDGGFFPAADGNVCARGGAAGVCRGGACIRCGDGVIEEGETCDDGNLDSDDACPINCLEARCGDGFVQVGVEECDDGNTTEEDACLTTCARNVCGDGFVDAAVEECDDQNGNENDGCSLCALNLWRPTLAFGLGRDGGAPASASLTSLGPLAATRSGLLYAGWSRITSGPGIIETNYTIGGVYLMSAAANVVLPATRRDGGTQGEPVPEQGLARGLQLGQVTGLTTDARGNLLLTMVNYSSQTAGTFLTFGAYVLRLDLDGTLTIVAGDEQRCLTTPDTRSCGGLGRARDATFSDLNGLAFDRRGRLHIVDGPSVRYIDADGTIQQRTGVSSEPCATTGCGDGGFAAAARFIGPLAIAVDADDNLYVADFGDHRVRRVEPDERITTVYGDGTACTDWPACDSGRKLNAPSGLALNGNELYIVDDRGGVLANSGSVVRRARLGQQGTDIIFGTGSPCDGRGCGDGGPATAAASSFIDGITVLVDGRIAITDVDSKLNLPAENPPTRVRVIDVGTNSVGPLAGRVGPEPPLTRTFPTSHDGAVPVWSDGGDLFFATAAHVFAVDPTTNYVELIAGADRCDVGSATCQTTSGPATSFSFSLIGDMDAGDGALYVADIGRAQVFAVSDGTVQHVFGAAQLCSFAVCGDVADARNAQVKSIGGISYDAGHLYVSDPKSHVVWDVTVGGGAARIAGTGVAGSSGDGGPALNATFRCPLGVLASNDGGVYITDPDSCVVRVVRAGTITEVASSGACVSPATLDTTTDCGRWDEGPALTPLAIVEDATGIVVGGTSTVSRITSGSLTRIAGRLPVEVPFELAEGDPAIDVPLAGVRLAGRVGSPLLIGARLAERSIIRRLAGDGTLRIVIGDIDGSITGAFAVAELFSPRSAARLDATSVLVTDGGTGLVRRVDTARRAVEPSIFGRFGRDLSSVTPVPARFATPLNFAADAIAVDPASHTIYLAASAEGQFATIDAPNFEQATTWTALYRGRLRDGPAGILGAAALAYDPVSARLYVSDDQKHGIYVLNPITLSAEALAGTPPFVGFAGDGGLASSALLDTPSGLAVAASGALYIADQGNHRVRKIDTRGIIDTVLGTGIASSEGSDGPARTLPVDSPTSLAFDQYGNLLVSAGPVLRVVYADENGEPSGTSLAGTLYDARAVANQRDVIRCLTAAFSGEDGEIYVADACSGAVLLLQRR